MVKMITKNQISRYLGNRREWIEVLSIGNSVCRYAIVHRGKVELIHPTLDFNRRGENIRYYDFSTHIVRWARGRCSKPEAVDSIYREVKVWVQANGY